MMSVKMATPGLHKIKVFWKKGYDVIIFVNDVTNKILSRDSNYIVDVVTWPKCGNSSISMREVNRNLKFRRIWPEKPLFFEGWSWFKFINLGLTLGMNVKFYTSVAKGLKLNVREFWGLISTFVEVTGEKLVGAGGGGLFALSRVKFCLYCCFCCWNSTREFQISDSRATPS